MNARRISPYSLLCGLAVVLLLIALLGLIALGIVRSITPDAPLTDESDPTATNTPTDIQTTDETAPDETDPSLPTADTDPVTLGETLDMGLVYQDSIIFVGDSTTAHLRSRGVLSDGTDTHQVWVPSDNTLLLDMNITKKKIVYPPTGEQMTIAEAAAKEQPTYMVLTIGLNGITSFVKDKNLYQNCYGKLIDEIKKSSPDTKIILQSIFPAAINQDAFSVDAATLNGYIDTVNGYVLELARNKDLRYLDTASALKGEDGYLPDHYQNGDGIHLTAEGYRAILAYIRTHGYQ